MSSYQQPTISPLGNVNGVTPFTLVAAGGLNPTMVKTGPTQLLRAELGCVVATPRYLKCYDVSAAQLAAAAIAAGSGIASPCVLNFIIPGNTAGAGSNFGSASQPPMGYQFQNGLAIQLSTEIALATQSGVTAGDCIVNLGIR